MTKVNRINFTSVINKLDLGSIIYPRVITAEYIIKYVRSMNKFFKQQCGGAIQIGRWKSRSSGIPAQREFCRLQYSSSEFKDPQKYFDLLYLP